MIQYALRCSEGHQFESWFQSGERFDQLKAAGHLTCAICGTVQVEKAIMAPRVKTSEDPAPVRNADPASAVAPSPSPAEALAAFKRHVEDNAAYVGGKFAAEARAIHDGLAPDRPIYGEARGDEAKKLIEDGVPVAPLPFIPSRKTN